MGAEGRFAQRLAINQVSKATFLVLHQGLWEYLKYKTKTIRPKY